MVYTRTEDVELVRYLRSDVIESKVSFLIFAAIGKMDKVLKAAIHHDMAFAFWDDACDLRSLFNCAWSQHDSFTKTGRIKILLNLVMACECALKAHVILSNPEDHPRELLRKIKDAGHNTTKLARLATFMQDRFAYESIISLLDKFGVEVRYSLNAANTYFRSDSAYDFYGKTVANPIWIDQVLKQLDVLIDACHGEVTGDVRSNFELDLQVEAAFEELMQRRRSPSVSASS